jgi:two-component system, chemotaxis family, protein-glutamate methylesterase/glutaminase
MSQVFLLPGEMHFSKEPTRLLTLLGSCVAVCLHDRRTKAGGMNHFLLPTATGSERSPGKCGDLAIAQLFKLARLTGSAPGDLVATLVGGGAVSGHLAAPGGMNLDIGKRNADMAEATLRTLGIAVIRRELLGTKGRRVVFETGTGQVSVTDIPDGTAQAAAKVVKTLIVDDSATVRGVLRQALGGDPRLTIVGEAEDPFKAREQILMHDPDVITLDIIMPNLDGLSFLRRLMAYKPIPTVVVSTIAKQGSDMRRMLEQAGAVAIFDKEDLALYQGLDTVRAKLIPVLLKAAATPVAKRA